MSLYATLSEDKMTLLYGTIIVSIAILGVVGPWIAPYDHDQVNRGEDGEVLRRTSPSSTHWLGTTASGQDILSRLLYGARPTVITGLVGGTMIITTGFSIGVTAGYFGGRTDDVLMRFTDMVYTVPIIPFAIVLTAFVGINFYSSILIIGALLWRGNARVLRSQVLQLKEQPFVKSAKALGGSDSYIIYKHIFPNIAPMAVLFFALGIGYSIILQAGLAFIGVSNTLVPSWGIMLRNAHKAALVNDVWWWAYPPGIMISITVLSTFMFGRKYEEMIGQDEKTYIQEAG